VCWLYHKYIILRHWIGLQWLDLKAGFVPENITISDSYSHTGFYMYTLFLFCWHFSYRTCAFCKARSDWLQLPLAALHINHHRVTSKIRLTMQRVKTSRADRNPWLAKMILYRLDWEKEKIYFNTKDLSWFFSYFLKLYFNFFISINIIKSV
jgi:hypothetical protein